MAFFILLSIKIIITLNFLFNFKFMCLKIYIIKRNIFCCHLDKIHLNSVHLFVRKPHLKE